MVIEYYDRMLVLGQEGSEQMDVVVEFFNQNLDTLAPSIHKAKQNGQLDLLTNKALTDVVTPDQVTKLSDCMSKMVSFFATVKREYMRRDIDGAPLSSANFKDNLRELQAILSRTTPGLKLDIIDIIYRKRLHDDKKKIESANQTTAALGDGGGKKSARKADKL